MSDPEQTSPADARDRSSAVAGLLVAAALLVPGMAGCSSSRIYTSGNLPAEFRAVPVENAQIVDLSRFAGPPTSSDRIDCGDVVEISLAAGLDSDAISRLFVRVGDDGMAVLPEIGPLQLAGLDLMQAEHHIAAACVYRRLYRQPHVTVAMVRQRVNRVTVVGGVEEPGSYELPRRSSYLLDAIVAAGGLSEEAGTKVEIRHPPTPGMLAVQSPAFPGQQGVQWAGGTATVPDDRANLVCLDLAEAVHRGSGGEYLRDGSVVQVERLQPDPVKVVGLVHKPGRYEFPVNHELHLYDVIAEAGGVSSSLADKVIVVRESPHGLPGRAAIQVSLRKAKQDPQENLQLSPGDIISVEQTPATAIAGILTSMIRFGISGSVPMF